MRRFLNRFNVKSKSGSAMYKGIENEGSDSIKDAAEEPADIDKEGANSTGTTSGGKLTLENKLKIDAPLIGYARELKRNVEALNNSIDGVVLERQQMLHGYCDRLELNVTEAIAGAMRNLNDTYKELLDQIKEFRESSLLEYQKTPGQSGNNDVLVDYRRELDAIWKESETLVTKWDDYFDDANTFKDEKAMHQAIIAVKNYSTRLDTLKLKILNSAYNEKALIFKSNYSFVRDKDFMRNFLCLFLENGSIKDGIAIERYPLRILLKHKDGVFQTLYLPDGRLVSCSMDKTVRIWDFDKVNHATVLNVEKIQYFSLALLKNGWIACGARDIVIWNARKQKKIRTLRGHDDFVTSLLSMKNGRLASYSPDSTIKIWDPFSKKNNLLTSISCDPNTTLLCGLKVSSNHQLITYSDQVGIIKTLDPNDGKEISSLRIRQHCALTMCVLTNDQVVLGFRNGSLKLVDIVNGIVVRTKAHAHLGAVTALVELPNGHLASAGTDRLAKHYCAEIKVWLMPDLWPLQLIQTNHLKHISSLSISFDEKYLASASRDATIYIWNIHK